MTRKIPPDAFSYYVGLGLDRSYQALADHYAVSKQAVVKAAKRDRWQERLVEIERKAQEGADQRAVDNLEAMNGRHLKTLQAIQARALEALRTMPLASAMEAVRALDMCITKERLVRGEPSDRTAVSVEDAIRREYDRWMVPKDSTGEDADGGEAA